MTQSKSILVCLVFLLTFVISWNESKSLPINLKFLKRKPKNKKDKNNGRPFNQIQTINGYEYTQEHLRTECDTTMAKSIISANNARDETESTLSRVREELSGALSQLYRMTLELQTAKDQITALEHDQEVNSRRFHDALDGVTKLKKEELDYLKMTQKGIVQEVQERWNQEMQLVTKEAEEEQKKMKSRMMEMETYTNVTMETMRNEFEWKLRTIKNDTYVTFHQTQHEYEELMRLVRVKAREDVTRVKDEATEMVTQQQEKQQELVQFLKKKMHHQWKQLEQKQREWKKESEEKIRTLQDEKRQLAHDRVDTNQRLQKENELLVLKLTNVTEDVTKWEILHKSRTYVNGTMIYEDVRMYIGKGAEYIEAQMIPWIHPCYLRNVQPVLEKMAQKLDQCEQLLIHTKSIWIRTVERWKRMYHNIFRQMYVDPMIESATHVFWQERTLCGILMKTKPYLWYVWNIQTLQKTYVNPTLIMIHEHLTRIIGNCKKCLIRIRLVLICKVKWYGKMGICLLKKHGLDRYMSSYMRTTLFHILVDYAAEFVDFIFIFVLVYLVNTYELRIWRWAKFILRFPIRILTCLFPLRFHFCKTTKNSTETTRHPSALRDIAFSGLSVSSH